MVTGGLKKTRQKFERAIEQVERKVEENLKYGESELQNNLKSKFN